MNPLKVFAGVTLVMVGLAMLALSSVENADYGAVVVIGPLPIVVASSPDMAALMLLFAVMVIILAFTLSRW